MTSSRDAIVELMLRYARHTDAGDNDEVGRLFEHGPFETSRGTSHSGAQMAEGRRRNIVTYDGSWRTKHVTTNIMVDVDESAGDANARSYFTLLQQPPERPLVPLACGRYHDRFERVDGAWRFALRRTTIDLWGDLSTHLKDWQPTELPYSVPPGGPSAEELPPMPLPSEPYAAIETLIYTYAERHDLGDADGVGRLFAHGPRRNGYDGAPLVGEDLARTLRRIQRHDGSPRTKHVTTNVLIEHAEGAATASGRSYFTVFQATRPLPLQVIAAGRYDDRFEQVDGAWRFTERVIVLDLAGDLSQHAALRRSERSNRG